MTCAIYFNKLVNTLIQILQSPRFSPFGRFKVVDYLKRIEFQHRGSPHAHILLWLDNAPVDPLGKNYADAINMIDQLISVSSSEASGHIKLNTHKHTFTCYKKIVRGKDAKCRFDAPFTSMTSRVTMITIPMKKDEPGFQQDNDRYKALREAIENNDYADVDDFYQKNNITSDEDYVSISQSGITRPRVFLRRHLTEKWHNPFKPFIFNILRSNMDIQFITRNIHVLLIL